MESLHKYYREIREIDYSRTEYPNDSAMDILFGSKPIIERMRENARLIVRFLDVIEGQTFGDVQWKSEKKIVINSVRIGHNSMTIFFADKKTMHMARLVLEDVTFLVSWTGLENNGLFIEYDWTRKRDKNRRKRCKFNPTDERINRIVKLYSKERHDGVREKLKKMNLI